MKIIIILATVLSASLAFAQKNQVTFMDSSHKILNLNLGMTSSAINLGARLDTSKSPGSLGGYFFIQTEKNEAGVGQVITFGGHTQFRFMDTNTAFAYFAPGAGLAMVKGGNGDNTVLGPSFRYGAQIKLSNGGAIGVEHFEIWNWFDSKTANAAAFTSAVYSISFN